MAIFSSDFSVSGVNTAGSALVNLKAGATYPISVMRVSVFYSVLSTTAYDIGVTRMLAVGTGTITSAVGSGFIATGTTPGSTSSASVVETAWVTTRPTAITSPAARFERGIIPLTIGAGYIWDFGPDGIVVPAAGGLLIYGIGASGATAGTLVGSIRWDE